MDKLKKALAERNQPKKIEFAEFSLLLNVMLHFSDNMSRDDINVVLNDWYTLYKEQREPDAEKWALDNLSVPMGVSRDSHDFWLDAKGLKILELEKIIKSLDGRTTSLVKAGGR